MKGGEFSPEPVHKAVLLKEVLGCFNASPGRKYIDATLGQAGHSLEIARAGGKVLGIEANRETFDWVINFLSGQNDDLRSRITPVLGNFVDIDKISCDRGFTNVDGILFDLGLNSFEFKDADLGLSFQVDGPLDMRLSRGERQETAADLVNKSPAEDLYRVLIRFGEERDAGKIVGAIVTGRRRKKIETTFDLVSLIDSAYQSNGTKNERRQLNDHKAKVFQALRIAVNRELENLSASLPKALSLIKTGGRLCVISFHSLEDRAVKAFFKETCRAGKGGLVVEKPVVPSRLEVERNYAARSAKLRILEKYDW